MTTTVLDREMYTEAEAARLLRVSPSTLHYWLEGGERRNKTYQPIIRLSPVAVTLMSPGLSSSKPVS